MHQRFLISLPPTNMKHSSKPKNKLPEPRRSNRFSGIVACFGGSLPSGKKLITFDHSKKTSHHRWLLSPYWSKYRMKRTASSKTVPFDPLFTDVSNQKIKFCVTSPPYKTPLKSKSLAGVEVPATDEAQQITVVKKAHQDVEANTGLNLPLKSPVSPKHGETCHNAGNSDSKLPRKTLSIRRPSRSSSSTHLTQHDNNNGSSLVSRSSDPLTGLMIVLMTLLIMIIWGRLCAILCTSAWLYFVRRFRSGNVSRREGKGNGLAGILNLKMDEEESNKNMWLNDYKKRVVLDGFLERENRRSFK